MDIKLISKLQEDLFKPASAQDKKERKEFKQKLLQKEKDKFIKRVQTGLTVTLEGLGLELKDFKTTHFLISKDTTRFTDTSSRFEFKAGRHTYSLHVKGFVDELLAPYLLAHFI